MIKLKYFDASKRSAFYGVSPSPLDLSSQKIVRYNEMKIYSILTQL